MQLNRGRGWEDQGPTAQLTSMLPPDVSGMSDRYNGRREFTGVLYHSPEQEMCTVDTEPSYLGARPEEDRTDKSKHSGVNHVWTAHPHAGMEPGTRPEDHEDSLSRVQAWVPDARERHGLRHIDIPSVTIPHNCENHLPETIADAMSRPTGDPAFVRPQAPMTLRKVTR